MSSSNSCAMEADLQQIQARPILRSILSEDDELKYKKTQGTGIDGTLYHLKLIANYLLNAIDTLPLFRLGAEVTQKITGKFDDIVLIYNDPDLNMKSFLVQVKHKEKHKDENIKIHYRTLISETDNDFSIPAYFYSYIKHIINSNTSKNLGQIEALILFTNVSLNLTAECKVVEDKSISPLVRVDDTSGKFYKFTEEFMMELKCKFMLFTFEGVAKMLGEYLLRGGKKPEKIKENKSHRGKSSLKSEENTSHGGKSSLKSEENKSHGGKSSLKFEANKSHGGNSSLKSEENKSHGGKNSLKSEENKSHGGKSTLNFVENTSYNRIVCSLVNAAFEMNEDNSVCGLKEEFANGTGMFKADHGEIFRNSILKCFGLRTTHPKNMTKLNQQESLMNMTKLNQQDQQESLMKEKDDIITKIRDHLTKNQRVIAVDPKNVLSPDSLGDVLITDVKNFSQLFILATDQPSTQQLEQSVRDKLAQNEVLNAACVNKLVYGSFMDQITTWYRKEDPVYMNNNEILTKIKLYIKSQQFIRNPLDLSFSKECLKTLSLLLDCEERILHVSTESHLDLVILKISKALDYSNGDFYLLDSISLRNLEDNELNSNCKERILMILNPDEDIHFNLKSICNSSKIILLQNIDRKKICDFFSPNHVKHITVDVLFEDLSEGSKRNFLSKKCIKFINFFSKNLEIKGMEVLNIALNQLSSDKDITIGNAMDDDSDLLPKIVTDLDRDISADQVEGILMSDNKIILFETYGDETKERLSNILNYSETRINNLLNVDFIRAEEFNNYLRSYKDQHKTIYFVRINSDNCMKIIKAYNPNLYIKRKLRFRPTISVFPSELYKALVNSGQDIAVVISNLKSVQIFFKEFQLFNDRYRLDYLLEDGRLCLVEGAEAHANFLEKSQSFKTVHWFEKYQKKYVWKRTHGCLNLLREMKHDFDDVILTEEKEFVDLIKSRMDQHRLVVISDAPGKGKSTTLSTLSRRYMELGSCWVIRVDFKDHSVRKGLFELQTQHLTTENVVVLLSRINRLNINHALGRHLLTVCLGNKDRIRNKLVFMLDGFDEVPPKIMENAKMLIRFLKEETLSTVFVTTRKHYRTTLEDLCSVFATKFDKLVKGTIMFYMKEFFSIHLPYNIITDNELFGKITRSFNVHTFLEDNLGILNFPLHLQIFSIILLSNIRRSSDINFDSLEYPSVFSLLKEYIKVKVNMCGEKSDILLQPYTERDYYFVKQCHELLGKLAITAIFPESNFSVDVASELEDVKNRFLLLGIVQEDYYSDASNPNGVSQFTFIHRLFCEYYCAHLIFNNITNQKYTESLMPILDKVLEGKLDGEYSMLRKFITSFLSEPVPILNDIYNRAEVGDNCLLFNDDVKDSLNRSPLHYAAINKDLLMINQLLDNGWVHTVDITGRLPLHYYLMSRNTVSEDNHETFDYVDLGMKIFHLFLSPFSASAQYFDRNLVNSWSLIRGNIRPCLYNGINLLEDFTRDGNTPTINSVINGNLPLLKHLCERMDINEPNKKGKTPLHIAAELGRHSMLRYLVDRGGDVNSRDAEAKTPLDYAMKIKNYREYIKCIKYLFVECSGTTTVISSRDSQVLRDVLTADKHGNNLDSLFAEPFVWQHGHLWVYLSSIRRRHSLNLQICSLKPFISIGRTLKDNFYAEWDALDKKYYYPKSEEESREHGMHIGREVLVIDVLLKIRRFLYRNKSDIIFLLSGTQDRHIFNLFQITKKNITPDVREMVRIYKDEEMAYVREILELTNSSIYESTQDDWGLSVLHFLAYTRDEDLLKKFLENGAKYDVVNSKSITPAQVFWNAHHEECSSLQAVDELFKCCKDSGIFSRQKYQEYGLARDRLGKTVMHSAIEADRFNLIQQILDICNGDMKVLNATDDNAQNLLHYAAKKDKEDLVLQLLEQKVNSMCRDRDGRLPVDLIQTDSVLISIWRQSCELFEYYSNGYSNEDDAMSIIDRIKSHSDIPHYLMNTRDDHDNTLLEYAVRNGHLRVVIFILSNGGDYEVGCRIKDCPIYEIRRLFVFIHALFKKAYHKRTEPTLKYADANDHVKECILNARNSEGDTLLHCVRNEYLAKWLVIRCKDLNIKDSKGRTPLQRATHDNIIVETILKSEINRRLARI